MRPAIRHCSALLFFAGFLSAQAPADPPTAPVTPQKDPQRDEDKHILGVVPNYTAVNDPNAVFQPISARDKFRIARQDAFDPFSFALAGIYAGVAQWSNSYAGYGQGAQGYAKRYGAAFADGVIADYFTSGVFPTILHQDPRYFRRGTGSAWRRVGYALTRVAVTRGDNGKWQLNASEFAGNAVAAGIANLYYPAGSRGAGATLDKFALNVGSDAGFNVLKEFWPDMRRKILHRE